MQRVTLVQSSRQTFEFARVVTHNRDARRRKEKGGTGEEGERVEDEHDLRDRTISVRGNV